MATSVEITPNAAKGTIEFKRMNGADLLQAILFSTCFQIYWNKDANEKVFDVFSSENHFVIDYREVSNITYPSPQDFYYYLVSLANCAASESSGDITSIAQNIDTLVNYNSLGELIVTSIGKTLYAPVVANEAIDIASESAKRLYIIIQSYDKDLWVRPLKAETTPTVRTGWFVPAGGNLESEPMSDGRKYLGPLSIINAVDGDLPNYSFVKMQLP